MAGTSHRMDKIPSLEDVTCPICLSLLVEPVSLPCHHAMCLSCFKEHVTLTSLVCPVCRTRISVWVRRNSKTNTLVDTKLWQIIQINFPDKVAARRSGTEEEDESAGVLAAVQQRVSQPGEIRQEYESFLAQQTQEAAQMRNKEENASIKLIQQLQEEERAHEQERAHLLQNLAQEDFMIAQQLEESEKIQLQTQKKKMQELCEQDEDVAQQLEAVERRTSRLQSKVNPNSKTVPLSPKGPMDLFIGKKGTGRGKQSLACVLGSSDTNTTLLMDPPASPLGQAEVGRQLKDITAQSSESESEDLLPSSPRRARPATHGKENSHIWRKERNPKLGKGKARRVHHSMDHKGEQLSPDIDSYSTTAVKRDSNHVNCRNPGVIDKGRAHIFEEEIDNSNRLHDRVCVTGEEADSDNDAVLDLTTLQDWERDKESLAALISEQKAAEAKLQQELQDRLLAEALQQEYNSQMNKVVRTKGSEDEYSLRQRSTATSPCQQQAGPSGTKGIKRPAGPSKSKEVKRQATLSEVMSKRIKPA